MTLDDLKQRLATQLDECGILDLLEINSYDLVEYLEEPIKQKRKYIISELELLYEDEEEELDFE